MAYQVIARAWRPKTFQDLIGQSHVSQTLVNALKSERLPHALLFTGPRGTGKTSSARILAKTLRCPKAIDFVPCGACSDCLEINEGQAVDVVEIDGASNNGVDAIRELRETVGYMPSSGQKKIYIIDEVHMLTTSAFNALLKTLEEPPPHVIFVMATTEVHKIPNTILSRCQRFDFRRIPLRLVAEHLKKICESEGAQASSESIWMIARQGEGSMRDSESLLDQVITFCQKNITAEKVSEILGLTERQLLVKTLRAIIDNSPKDILPLLSQIFYAGTDSQLFCKDLLEEVRHLLLIKIQAQASPTGANASTDLLKEIVDLSEEEIQQLQALATELSQESIHMLFDMLLKGERDMVMAQDPQLVLEMLLLRMASAPRVEALLHHLKKAENSAQSSTSAAQAAIPVAPKVVLNSNPTVQSRSTVSAPVTNSITNSVAKPPARPTQSTAAQMPPVAAAANTATANAKTSSHSDGVQQAAVSTPAAKESSSGTPVSSPAAQAWADLVGRVKKVNSLMGTQLEHCFLTEWTDEKITLGIPLKMKFLYDQASQASFKKKLHNYTKTFWGKELSIAIVSSEKAEDLNSTPKAMMEQQQSRAQDDLIKKVAADPLIHSMNQIFKSEVKELSKR